MWPFTKKTKKKETVVEKKEIEKNEILVYARGQINAQLTKSLPPLNL